MPISCNYWLLVVGAAGLLNNGQHQGHDAFSARHEKAAIV
jgi:hypothetical protein